MESMKKLNVILASASPRRQELLQKILTDFTVIPADIDESQDQKLLPRDYVLSMAERKAQMIYKKHPGTVVIGCDTIVVCQGKMFQKPKSYTEALQMLTTLSGKTHTVYTSVVIIGNGQIVQKTVPTEVTFFSLSEEEIKDYLLKNEYKDKAGAYAIQGEGRILVKQIKGDYYSVVGFPIAHVHRMLQKCLAG